MKQTKKVHTKKLANGAPSSLLIILTPVLRGRRPTRPRRRPPPCKQREGERDLGRTKGGGKHEGRNKVHAHAARVFRTQQRSHACE